MVKFWHYTISVTQPAFTCSMLTVEALEKSLKYAQIFWAYFTPCSSDSIVNFEHVNVDWETLNLHLTLDRHEFSYLFVFVFLSSLWVCFDCFRSCTSFISLQTKFVVKVAKHLVTKCSGELLRCTSQSFFSKFWKNGPQVQVFWNASKVWFIKFDIQ